MQGFEGRLGGLSFALPTRSPAPNRVRIELMASDTYDVTFLRVHGATVTEIAKHTDAYCDDIQGLVCDATGLVASL